MIDTLHLEIPRGSSYTKTYLRTMSKLSPETERKAVKRGRDFSQVVDLRYFDIPALLHVCCTRDKDTGDKFEFIGAGGLGLSEWVGYMREVFLTDAHECGIFRMDTTADLDGSFVPWCRENVRVAGKQCVQLESPSHSFREVSQRCYESIYWGKRKGQNTAYDKTGERRYLLQKKRRKMTREARAALSLEDQFLSEYGYSIFKPMTRFERRMVGRESGKVYGIERFGQIERASFINPFERWEFPEQAHDRTTGRIPRGLDEFSILYLRDLVKRDGLTNARNAMMRSWGRRVFYPRYKAILPLILDLGTGPTQNQVREAYVESNLKQFAA